MSSRKQKRAAILKRLSRSCDLARIMKEGGFSAQQVADTALKFQDACLTAFGGPAQFTGNNRTFANGAIAYEVRCKKCRGLFWVTATPYAWCSDCDPRSLFR